MSMGFLDACYHDLKNGAHRRTHTAEQGIQLDTIINQIIGVASVQKLKFQYR